MSNSNLSVTIKQTNISVKMYQRWPKWEGIPQWWNTGEFLVKQWSGDYDVWFAQIIDDVSTSLTKWYSSQKTQALIDAVNDVLKKKPSLSVSDVSFKCWLPKFIDQAQWGVSRSSGGWIEDEKFWFYLKSFWWDRSAKFDNDHTYNGKKTLHGWIDAGRYFEINTLVTRWYYWVWGIEVDPSTKYSFSVPVKTALSGDSNNWVHVMILMSDENWSSIWSHRTEYLKGNNDWQELSIDFTTPSNAKYINVQYRNYWHTWADTLAWDTWFAVMDASLVAFAETTNAWQVGVQDMVSHVVAKPNVYSIDDTQLVNDRYQPLLGNSFASRITLEKRKFTGITLAFRNYGSTPSGNLTVKLMNDSWGLPWSTTYITTTVNSAEFTNTWAIIEKFVALPIDNLIGDYQVVVDSSLVTGWDLRILASIATINYWWLNSGWGWTNRAPKLFYKTHHMKNCWWVWMTANGKTIELKASSEDGVIPYTTFDLINGKFWTLNLTSASLDWVDDIYWAWYTRRDVLMRSAYWKYTKNKWSAGSTKNALCVDEIDVTKWYILKVDWFGMPITGLDVYASLANVWGNPVLWVAWSLDAENWTNFWVWSENLTDDIIGTLWGISEKVFYISIYRKGWSDVRITSLRLQWSVDTSLLEIPRSYPTWETNTETLFGKAQKNTTTLTYRENEYSDDWVYYPAIEFADNDWIKLPFDLRDCSACVVTAYDATGAQIGTGNLLADWSSISITSNKDIYMVFDFVMTKNTLRCRSSNYHAGVEKVASLQATIWVLKKSQGMYYDILDLKWETPIEERNDVDYIVADDSGWIEMNLINWWVDFSSEYMNAKYRRIGWVVYIDWLIKSGSTSIPFVLPEWFRPPRKIMWAVTTNSNTHARMDVDSAWQIILTSYSNAYVSLHMSFLI